MTRVVRYNCYLATVSSPNTNSHMRSGLVIAVPSKNEMRNVPG